MYEQQKEKDLNIDDCTLERIDQELKVIRDTYQDDIQTIYRKSAEIQNQIKEITKTHRQRKKKISLLITTQRTAIDNVDYTTSQELEFQIKDLTSKHRSYTTEKSNLLNQYSRYEEKKIKLMKKQIQHKDDLIENNCDGFQGQKQKLEKYKFQDEKYLNKRYKIIE